MNTIKNVIFAVSLLASTLKTASGGIAIAWPTKWFFDGAALVVILEVKKVTKVEVSTGTDGFDSGVHVYVAEAEVLQTLKSDYDPTPKKRTIAVVGSTIPDSSAVWRPIVTTRYLAFLNGQQGHYSFTEKFAMRPINPDGKVEWLEKNAQEVWEVTSIDVEEAIKRIQREQDGGGQPATRPKSK